MGPPKGADLKKGACLFGLAFDLKAFDLKVRNAGGKYIGMGEDLLLAFTTRSPTRSGREHDMGRLNIISKTQPSALLEQGLEDHEGNETGEGGGKEEGNDQEQQLTGDGVKEDGQHVLEEQQPQEPPPAKRRRLFPFAPFSFF